MGKRVLLQFLVVWCMGVLTAVPAWGQPATTSPPISINTLVDWDTALLSGQVRPVEGGVFQDMVADPQAPWPPEYKTARFFTPQLAVMPHEDSQGSTHPALIMRWGDPQDQTLIVGQTRVAAAWDVAMPQGAPLDLTRGDKVLEFSVHAPAECMFVSLNLLDQQNRYREWIWHVGNQPGEIPPCQWTTVWVDPVAQTSNFNPTALFTVGQGFDLSGIQFIRFDENGIWSPEFQDQTGLVWNAWDHVQQTPEPITLLGLLGGACMLRTYVRRRRS